MVSKGRVAHPAHDENRQTAQQRPYVLRGLGLFELHREELLESYQGGGRWIVPGGSGRLYEVRTGTRPERDRCECRGFASHKHCSHLVAAHRAARRSAVCDGCARRLWWRDLIQVTEDHDSLTWFVGDVVCDRCARGTDIL